MLIVTAGVVCVCLASNDDAVRAASCGRGEAGVRHVRRRRSRHVRRLGSGSNQPTVRLDSAEHRARGGGDLFERHRGDPRAEVREHVDAGDGLEVTDLMRDVRDAVVLEHEPRVQLRLRFRQLGRRDAVARDAGRARRASRASTSPSGVPSVAVAEMM